MTLLYGADSLVLFGDWHGNTRWATHILNRACAATSADVPVFYHVGDFGLWDLTPHTDKAPPRREPQSSSGFRYLNEVNAVLGDNNRELWVVLGNHENYDELNRMPADGKGVRRHEQFNNIAFLPRSFVWTDLASGKLLGSVGGAGSIDKRYRKENVSWWPQEEITAADIETYRNLPGSDRVDCFLSHDAPAGTKTVNDTSPPPYASPEILDYCHRQRILLREALDWSHPTVAFHGHWHRYNVQPLTGVTWTGQDYETLMVGLGMDDGQGNAVIYDTHHNTVTARV